MLILFLVAAGICPKAVTAHEQRGIWLWDTAELLPDSSRQKKFLTFLDNLPGTVRKVDMVYLYSTSGFLRSRDKRLGKAVHHSGALSFTETFIAYQKASGPNERFDGFQYDVEPHTLSAYNNPKYRDRIKIRFIELLKKTATALRAHSDTTPFGITVSAHHPEDFISRMLEHVDYLAVMDYMDTSKRILHYAQKYVRLADRLNKAIYIGLETQPPAVDGGGAP